MISCDWCGARKFNDISGIIVSVVFFSSSSSLFEAQQIYLGKARKEGKRKKSVVDHIT
jgi:hypothetical protein